MRTDAMTEKDYSLTTFNEFIDNMSSRGDIKRNTAQSRKAAVNKVLGVLEDNETSDLRLVDIDKVFDRFQNIHHADYTPNSLKVYLSRSKTAVADFISYIDDPSSFKPSIQQRQSPKSKKADSLNTQRKTPSPKNEVKDYGGADKHDETKHVTVPVPLRADLTVKISNLPADLTEQEADRLAAIVKAFAVPTQ